MTKKRKLPTIDLNLEPQGSIAILEPMTDAGKAWLEANTSAEGWQWLGPNLAIDVRFADEIMRGAEGAGLGLGFQGQACRMGALS